MSRRPSNLRLRPIEARDQEPAARIAFEAFAGVADRHGFQRDFPTLDAARDLVSAYTSHPSIWGVVAEHDGRIVGSNFLDERGPVRGVGPITVDPDAQSGGVGRLLMKAAIARRAGATSIRLLQESFNSGSLALYASLAFKVEEPTVLLTGTPQAAPPAGVGVRPLVDGDLYACEELCIAVHGFDRTNELRDALQGPGFTPVIAHRDGLVVAYATTLADFGAAYAVAATEADLFALIVGAVTPDAAPASFLLPLRQHDLLRSCLSAGLRIVKSMNYMVIGPYRRPQGAWIPSVMY